MTLFQKNFLIFIVFCSFVNLNAQSVSTLNWGNQLTKLNINQLEKFPKKNRIVKINYADLEAKLLNVTQRETQNSTIELPLLSGENITLQVEYASVMMPLLEKKYSKIKTYKVYSTDKSGVYGRIGISPEGFYSNLIINNENQMIRKLENNLDEYIVYDLNENIVEHHFAAQFLCGTDEKLLTKIPMPEKNFARAAEGKKMRNYRLALSCTSAFAKEHQYDIDKTMAFIVETVNLLNTRYNIDLGFNFLLIDKTDELLNLHPNTDYFKELSLGVGLLDQNQAFIESKLSAQEYDLAQVFTGNCSDVGGVVSGRACSDNSKAKGVSCLSNNVDYFYTTFKHELGHQFTGGHTFNSCNGSSQFNPNSSYEPGAGSTILSYGANCGTDNVGNRQDFFHVINVIEMTEFAKRLENTCGTLSEYTNQNPVLKLSYPNNQLFIPISTPFELDGTGIDPEGQNLFYTWEQFDIGAGDVLGSNFETGPLFVVSAPTNLGRTRSLPEAWSILSNISSSSERLPTVSRELNFKFTARDLNKNVGGYSHIDFKFRSTDKAGPFKVLSPNKEDTLKIKQGDLIDVIWDVANTDKGEVNTSNVNIMLSANDGLNFIDTLITNTPNDGHEQVMVTRAGTRIRFKVKAVNNMFFNINKGSIIVTKPSEPGFSLDAKEHQIHICDPLISKSISLKSVIWNNFNSSVHLNVISTGHPDLEVTFLNDHYIPPASNQIIIKALSNIPAGKYNIVFEAISNNDTLLRTIEVIKRDPVGITHSLDYPENGATVQILSPTFSWENLPAITGFEIQVSTSSTFDSDNVISQIVYNNNFTPISSFKNGSIYFWRVRAISECGDGDWSTISSFKIVPNKCLITNNDEIPIFGFGNTLPDTLDVKFMSSEAKIVKKISVSDLQLGMTGFDKVKIILEAPNGIKNVLYNASCDNSILDLFVTFDDEASQNLECITNNQLCKPYEAFEPLLNQPATGNWNLKFIGLDSTGYFFLSNGKLNLCFDIPESEISQINLDTVFVKSGGQKTVTNENISFITTFTNNSITYHITKNSQHGNLYLNGIELKVGQTFTQEDVDTDKLKFLSSNENYEGFDHLELSIIDKNNSLLSPVTLEIYIQKNIVGNHFVKNNIVQLKLYPNPVKDEISFKAPGGQSKTTLNEVQLYTIDGKQIFSISKKNKTIDQWKIDVHNLKNGVYLIRGKNDSQVFISQFVKL